MGFQHLLGHAPLPAHGDIGPEPRPHMQSMPASGFAGPSTSQDFAVHGPPPQRSGYGAQHQGAQAPLLDSAYGGGYGRQSDSGTALSGLLDGSAFSTDFPDLSGPPMSVTPQDVDAAPTRALSPSMFQD